ncbi:MAG: hypothetical protein ACYC54_15035 [Sedimentisphaerales bacterium]
MDNLKQSDKKSDKKSKYRITTIENFYRPKTYTIHTYNRFMKQFIDKRTFGINNKQHYHSTDYINNCLTSNSHFKRKLCESTFLHQLKHLNDDKFLLYYTNSPHTNIPLFCMDIDPIKEPTPSTPEDIQKAAQFLSVLHPNCYYEPSSSGKGLHFYFLVDFTSYRQAYGNDWSFKANQVIQTGLISYGKLIHEYINRHFNVKFDAIKSTISHYSWSKEYSCYIIDNQATLCKQPRPKSEDALHLLYNSPISSLSCLENNAIWLITQLFKQDNWQNENLRIELEKRKKALSPSSSPLSSFPVTVGKSFSSHEPNSSKNEGNEDSHKERKCEFLMQSSNAEQRYVGSIMALSHTLGYLPSVEQWHTYYVKKGLYTGSPELTEIRKGRFNRCVKYVAQTFDPSIISSHHIPLEYMENLKKSISPAELKQCCKETGYRYKINYVDLDMGAGYIYMSCMSNQKMGLELTVPTRGWINYHKYHKEKGTIKRLCTHEKIRAVKLALIKIGYIVCLDENYDLGCSMRYGLGSNHPKFDEYQLFCKKAETVLLTKKVKGKKPELSTAL